MERHRLGLMVDALEEARASLDRAQMHLIAVAGEELLTSGAIAHLQKRSSAAARELEGLIIWALERAQFTPLRPERDGRGLQRWR